MIDEIEEDVVPAKVEVLLVIHSFVQCDMTQCFVAYVAFFVAVDSEMQKLPPMTRAPGF